MPGDVANDFVLAGLIHCESELAALTGLEFGFEEDVFGFDIAGGGVHNTFLQNDEVMLHSTIVGEVQIHLPGGHFEIRWGEHEVGHIGRDRGCRTAATAAGDEQDWQKCKQ